MDKQITTLIFDCFGVICTPVLNNWYKENSIKLDLVDENLLDTFRHFDLGHMTEDDMLEYFLKYKGVNLNKVQLREEIDSYLDIDNNLVELMRQLKQSGYKIVLLTNANHAFFERKIYTQYPEFKNLFTELVISSEVGMVKPDPEIYRYTLDLVQSRPEESLFIDDNTINVDAAKALGINGFVYTDCASIASYLSSTKIYQSRIKLTP